MKRRDINRLGKVIDTIRANERNQKFIVSEVKALLAIYKDRYESMTEQEQGTPAGEAVEEVINHFEHVLHRLDHTHYDETDQCIQEAIFALEDH